MIKEYKKHNSLYEEFDNVFYDLLYDYVFLAREYTRIEGSSDSGVLEDVEETLEHFKNIRKVFSQAMSDRFDLLRKQFPDVKDI